MTEELLKVVSRIKATQDGIDLYEFLLTLSRNNYKAFKSSPNEFNDIHKGQAIALDGIIELFESCDDKLRKIAENERTAKASENDAGWA